GDLATSRRRLAGEAYGDVLAACLQPLPQEFYLCGVRRCSARPYRRSSGARRDLCYPRPWGYLGRSRVTEAREKLLTTSGDSCSLGGCRRITGTPVISVLGEVWHATI